jgi:hypothetical protein
MESLFKASVIFLLTFTMPTNTNKPKEHTMKPVQSTIAKLMAPKKEKGDFLFAGFLMIAE